MENGRAALDGARHRVKSQKRNEVSQMIWETPAFEEIDMSAEIGAYQGDFDGI